MKKLVLLFVFLVLIGVGGWYAATTKVPIINHEDTKPAIPDELLTDYATTAHEKRDLIVITSPVPGTEITSPLTVTGEARGYWFFEAVFPLILTDWDGRIIAEGYASAEGEWMTEDFVPFTGTLEFTELGKDVYSHRGTLIFKKDNPSGEPQFDDALEMPVMIK